MKINIIVGLVGERTPLSCSQSRGCSSWLCGSRCPRCFRIHGFCMTQASSVCQPAISPNFTSHPPPSSLLWGRGKNISHELHETLPVANFPYLMSLPTLPDKIRQVGITGYISDINVSLVRQFGDK